ncbi:MAG: class B sortase [Oscillospiraceae bacterium]|nr:class B sortase [Oscillospiraceae bacterium]
MKKRIYAILEVLFLFIFVFSAYKIYDIFANYNEGDSIYEDAQDTFISTKPEAEETEFSVDFEKLKETNKEILGWIYIPDTPVSYPLLQTDNNQYYLKHTYNHTYSDFGSIFIDTNCSPELTDDNTIIYGHNTKNGSMFGSLKKYKDINYLKEHPNIYIIYEDAKYTYEIISEFTTDTSYKVYSTNFGTRQKFRDWQKEIIGKSVNNTSDITPTGEEKLITLSTCTSRTETERFVVIARLVNIEKN